MQEILALQFSISEMEKDNNKMRTQFRETKFQYRQSFQEINGKNLDLKAKETLNNESIKESKKTLDEIDDILKKSNEKHIQSEQKCLQLQKDRSSILKKIEDQHQEISRLTKFEVLLEQERYNCREYQQQQRKAKESEVNVKIIY